jgi:hypothetical protein
MKTKTKAALAALTTLCILAALLASNAAADTSSSLARSAWGTPTFFPLVHANRPHIISAITAEPPPENK